ncbi:MAG: hypothetical protein RML40_10335, partial [Bacteroidota bacterium]|nr:hypothetical protein [Candidatus Kapabacteria bacterium]MDW8220910.1 hypothetical protein [Bacteroidota bacterium]
MNTFIYISPPRRSSRSGAITSLRHLLLSCIVAGASIALMTSCATLQGTKSDYFGFRNFLPTPASDIEREVSQQTWQNPMQSGLVSSVAFVPVITPWYDTWSMFARPSLRFWGAYDIVASWNSPWGFTDPFWGSFGSGFGWGSPWALGSFYDPFWGMNSSFMFFSSPWQRFNPYFGVYTPLGFYRPLGFWSSPVFCNAPIFPPAGNYATLHAPAQMREFGVQRSYNNTASVYTGTHSYGTAQYIGSYTATGNGGAFSR